MNGKADPARTQATTLEPTLEPTGQADTYCGPRKAGKTAATVSASGKPAGRVRDRIFETACELFQKNGLRDVCVDEIATQAGSNKMSFYRNFASKDELVAEFLREQVREYWDWWDTTIAPLAGNPREQLEVLFQEYEVCGREISADPSEYGCAVSNAAVELRDPDHPGMVIVREFKAELRHRLREMARAAGARDPDYLGDALQLILAGSYLMRLYFKGSDGPAEITTTLARMMLDSQLG